MNRLRYLGDLLDTRFRLPVVGWRVGLDGLIGLVPGIGDTVAGGLSAYLVYEAWLAGARKRTIARMAANVAFDFVVGLVPVVGDLFDFAYKANARNVRLLIEDLEGRTRNNT